MCGISVIIDTKSKFQVNSLIFQMTELVRHRGPDDEGYVIFSGCGEINKITPCYGANTPKNVIDGDFPYSPKYSITRLESEKFSVAFGHRRLSIVDLSPNGHQPMCYGNQRYWIVYNGEIYNHHELRDALTKLGHRFISHTDTEVLLAAYVQWGTNCLHHLNGMWAFVIFDTQELKIFASRDRFGVKPLYYWFSPDGLLAFASEIKQFTALPGWKPALNKECAYDYLIMDLMDHTPETLFHGVYQIPGGHAVEFHLSDDLKNTLQIYRWYQLEKKPFQGTFAQAAEEFRHLFTDSVRLRMHADVPVGSCLSGGLDSSAIVCIANDLLKQEKKEELQKTFSAISDVKKFDEREFINEVVSDRTLDAHYIVPTPEKLSELLDSIIWHQDEPFGTTSIFAQWLVFKLAADQGAKVLLDGQGADEQLCGYQIFSGARQADLLVKLKWGEMIHEMDLAKKTVGISLPKSISLVGIQILPSVFRKFFFRMSKKAYIDLSWFDDRNTNPNSDITGCHGFVASSYIQQIIYSQLFYTSLPLLLHWEDRDSMAHSVESRVPFLDYRLVEFIFNLPDEFKIQMGITKKVFRESMGSILPEKIRIRKDKMGFVTAEENWVTQKMPECFQEMLKNSIECSHGIIKKESLAQLNSMIEGKTPYSSMIWRVICFGRWMKIFKVDAMF